MFQLVITPPAEPIPAGHTCLNITMRQVALDLLLESCLRRGMPLLDLVADALIHAIDAP